MNAIELFSPSTKFVSVRDVKSKHDITKEWEHIDTLSRVLTREELIAAIGILDRIVIDVAENSKWAIPRDQAASVIKYLPLKDIVRFSSGRIQLLRTMHKVLVIYEYAVQFHDVLDRAYATNNGHDLVNQLSIQELVIEGQLTEEQEDVVSIIQCNKGKSRCKSRCNSSKCNSNLVITVHPVIQADRDSRYNIKVSDSSITNDSNDTDDINDS